MLRAVHFHDQPHGGGEEIGDSRAKNHLPAKSDPERAAGQALPEPALRLRRRAPILASARSEHVLASGSC
jgi:hypothetical protein